MSVRSIVNGGSQNILPATFVDRTIPSITSIVSTQAPGLVASVGISNLVSLTVYSRTGGFLYGRVTGGVETLILGSMTLTGDFLSAVLTSSSSAAVLFTTAGSGTIVLIIQISGTSISVGSGVTTLSTSTATTLNLCNLSSRFSIACYQLGSSSIMQLVEHGSFGIITAYTPTVLAIESGSTSPICAAFNSTTAILSYAVYPYRYVRLVTLSVTSLTIQATSYNIDSNDSYTVSSISTLSSTAAIVSYPSGSYIKTCVILLEGANLLAGVPINIVYRSTNSSPIAIAGLSPSTAILTYINNLYYYSQVIDISDNVERLSMYPIMYALAGQISVYKTNLYSVSFAWTNNTACFSNQITWLLVSSYDAYSNFVTVMLSGNGTNGSTTFIDSSPLAWSITVTSPAQISTGVLKFGTGSIYLSSNGYLSINQATSALLGLYDFTVDLWMYPNGGQSSLAGICGNCQSGVGSWGIAYDTTAAGIAITLAGSYGDLYGTSTIWPVATYTWTHVAFVRSGSNLMLFINGILKETANFPFATTYDEGSGLTVGAWITNLGTYRFSGYIDDFRITKGIARYTSNFTPSTIAANGTGEIVYNSPGTYTWTCPAGVSSISVVAVGAGGTGSATTSYGGGGGALSYINDVTVIPGNLYTVVVGSPNGADSSFNVTTVIAGSGNGPVGGSVIIGNGGNGGNSNLVGGGGGAGGYSGNGGAGGYTYSVQPTSGSGGGGSGGGSSFTNASAGGGGGGVGLLGQGTDGVCLNNGPWGTNYGAAASAGGAGSSGSNGAIGGTAGGIGGAGGAYGGGGGGGGTIQTPSSQGASGAGSSGAIRIIWPGTLRKFPSTNTGTL